MNNLVLGAQAPGATAGIIYLLIIGLAFYFFIFRPNKKQKGEFDKMLESLKVGDDVVTRSGVKGKIVDLDDVYFTLETGNGAQITYVQNALAYIVTPVDDSAAENEADSADEDEDEVLIEEEELIDEEEDREEK